MWREDSLEWGRGGTYQGGVRRTWSPKPSSLFSQAVFVDLRRYLRGASAGWRWGREVQAGTQMLSSN